MSCKRLTEAKYLTFFADDVIIFFVKIFCECNAAAKKIVFIVKKFFGGEYGKIKKAERKGR